MVYTSDVIENNKLDFKIKSQLLCSTDYDRKLKFEIIHKRSNNKIQSQYSNFTSLNKIFEGKREILLGDICIVKFNKISEKSITN